MQINEMRKNVAFGCGEKGRRGLGIDLGGEGFWAGRAIAQSGQNSGFAGLAVRDQLAQADGRCGNLGPMSRQKTVPVPTLQRSERGHIGRHITLWRRDERG